MKANMKRDYVVLSMYLMGATSLLLSSWDIWGCSILTTQTPLVWNHGANVTLVTAIYDLGRLDRSFDSTYAHWINETIMATPAPFVVFCHEKHVHLIPQLARVRVIIQNTLPLYSLQSQIYQIVSSQHDKDENYSPEFMNNEYLLLTYSKFKWLQQAITLDPFRTSHFFWADAGLCRFFSGPVTAFTPRFLHPSRVVIQQYNFDKSMTCLTENDVVWGTSRAWLAAGYFGGERIRIWRLCKSVLFMLRHEMLPYNIADNEQMALSLLYIRHPQWFRVVTFSDFNLSKPHMYITL